MLAVELAVVLTLLALCSFAPGFFWVRRLPWTPLEKLCGAVGLSLVLLYLAAWGIYCFGPQDQRFALRAVAAAAMLLGAAAWRDTVRLAGCPRVRRVLAGYGFLLAFTLAMLSMIRVYSGAGWAADWYEHFHRSLFFLHRLPTATVIFPGYPLPARPPLMNVVAAFYLGVTRDEFAIFQVVLAFLNLLLFLPCALLLPALGGSRRPAVLPLAALFAASPVVMENITYTWTKALAAFFVVLALALYLAGRRKRESTRTVAAFAALTAGLLAHYSAGPYLVFVTLDYLVRLPRQRRWREAAAIAMTCGLLAATWFGWSARVYGMETTLASNTSVTGSAQYDGSNLEKIGANLFDTLVPAWMRGAADRYEQGNAAGQWRDRAFAFYQLNLIFAMGAVGGPLALWLLWRRLGPGGSGRERNFWRALVPFCVVVGVAVVGERDAGGVPHLTLLALEALGLALVAAQFRNWPKAVRWLVVAGCVVDFGLGVFLQARVESIENTPRRTVFTGPQYSRPKLTINQPAGSLGRSAWVAWTTKHRAGLFPEWLENLPLGHAGDPDFRRQWIPLVDALEDGLRDDAVNWGGWAARHGGVVAHLGDRVAGVSGRGVDGAALVFALLFLGLLAALARQAAAAQPVSMAEESPVYSTGFEGNGR